MTDLNRGSSTLAYARFAGICYLLIMGLATIGVGFIDSNLIVDGDRSATAENIIAGSLQFRAGIAVILAMYAAVVVLSGALFIVLQSVDRNLALLALLLRTAEAILGGATVLLSFVVLEILTGEAGPALHEGQKQALAGLLLDARAAGLDVVLVFVGLGGTLFCYLFFRSRSIPRALAVWGMFTYLSMLVLAFVSILIPDHPPALESLLYGLGGAFEFVVGGWLLVRGVDVQRLETRAGAASSGHAVSR